MKFSAMMALSGLLAVASALAAPQETSTASAVQTAEGACLAKCNPGDVNCQAACITVPSPNSAMVNATTSCAANCVQGSGSAADTQKYSDCVQSCISSFFFTTMLNTAATGAESTAAATGSDVTTTNSAGSTIVTHVSASPTGTKPSSGSGTSTGAAASSTSKGASSNLRVGGSAAGLAGLLAAVFAL